MGGNFFQNGWQVCTRIYTPSYDEWRRVDETTWAFDAKYLSIRRCPYPVRTVLTKAVDAKGRIDYRHIYTSFSPKEMDEIEVAISPGLFTPGSGLIVYQSYFHS